MFKKHWWTGKIVSDEGFAVRFTSRNTLLYEVGGKAVTIRTEGDGKAIDVFENSIVRWDNDPSRIDALTRKLIADNVVRALEFRGFRAVTVTG